MKRKIISQGIGGRTIFLPISWVRRHGLEPGDEITLVDSPPYLIISSGLNERDKKKEIQLSSEISASLMRSLISSSYKAGFSHIDLKSEKNLKQKIVKKVLKSFVGLESYFISSKHIVIKSDVGRTGSDIDNAIVKMFQMINLICEEIASKVGTDNMAELKESIGVNLKMTRDYCLRTIHSINYEQEKSYDYYELVTVLEKIGAEFFEIAHHIKSDNPKKNHYFDDLKSLFAESYAIFLKKDFQSANLFWMKLSERKKSTNYNGIKKEITKEQGSIITPYYNQIRLYRQLSSRLLSICS